MTPIDLVAVALGVLFGVLAWRRPALLERPVAVGAIWSVLIALPFWVLGPASLVEGGDPVLSGLPSLLIARSHHSYFWGAFAGVEPGLMAAGPTAAAVGFEPALVHVLPLWLALLIPKLVATVIAFAGGYLLGRKTSGSVAIGVVCGLWASIPGYAYASSLNNGLSLVGMSLAAYVIAGRLDARRYWPAAIALALLWPLSNLPLQLIPAMALSWLAVAVAMRAPLRGMLRLGGAAALLLAALGLNWSESIFGFMQVAGEMGRHIQKTPSDVLDNMIWAIGKIPFIWQGSVAFAAILIMTEGRKSARFMGAIAIAVLPGPLLQMLPFERLGVGFLDGYNFSYAVFALIPPSVVLLAEALVSLRRFGHRLPAAAVPALAAAAVVAYTVALWVPAIVSMVGVGGLRGASATSVLDPATYSGYRFITVPIGLSPPMTAANGLDTFDGYDNSMPGRLRAYWDMGVLGNDPPTGLFHGYAALPERHHYEGPVPYALAKDVSLRLLRRANVGFVISRVPIIDPGVTLVAQKGAAVTDWQSLGKLARVRARVNDLLDGPSFSVYRVEGAAPRVFLASAVVRSAHRFTDPGFYRDLAAGSDPTTAVLDATAPNPPGLDGCCERGRLAVDELDGDHLVAHVDQPTRPGLLVFNATWTKFHRARLDGRPVEPIPVDGFQIGIIVPVGSHDIGLDYYRRSLWRTISAAVAGG